MFVPVATVRWSMTSPSRLIFTWAVPAGAPESSTLYVMVCCWPTMPKRGAETSTTRRSRSLRAPVISVCSGAAKPSAAASPGTSCTRPSVIMKAPATRSGGTSESVAPSAWKSRVPSVSPSAWPASTTRSSRPGMRCRLFTSASRAACVCLVRSPKLWLGLLSTTTTATEVSGSRSSRVSDGLASASTRSRSAIARVAAPRVREISNSTTIAAATTTAAHTTASGTSGENVTPKPKTALLLAEPLEQRRHVHLVGLVVAGQRVHHDVDPGAVGEIALARLARHQRQHRLAVAAHRPGAGEVVRRDDDRGHPVAAARRALGVVVVLVLLAVVRQRL